MTDYSNILFVSGSGRNVGKTWLACQLISKFAGQPVTGIKISPHLHEIDEGADYIVNRAGLQIIRETRTGNKDSMLMLKAGAKEAFYVQIDGTENENYVVHYVINYVDPFCPVIVESGFWQGMEAKQTSVYLSKKGDAEKYLDRIEYKHKRWIIHESND